IHAECVPTSIAIVVGAISPNILRNSLSVVFTRSRRTTVPDSSRPAKSLHTSARSNPIALITVLITLINFAMANLLSCALEHVLQRNLATARGGWPSHPISPAFARGGEDAASPAAETA